MKTSLKRRDYHECDWSVGEWASAGMKAVVIVCFLAFSFYRSLWACIPLSGVGVLYFRSLMKKKINRCREELVLQFKECILSVAASLRAGYAVENAFLESRSEIELIYGKGALIYEELEWIRRGLVINITLEEQLFELAERSGSEEIAQFATVFLTAKKNGGNLTEIIGATAELIGQRIDTKQEIQTMLSGRKMEQTIMKGMPFAVLFYIGIAYPGYFDMLYHNWQGVLIMTFCLAVYLAAYVLGEKILHRIASEMT